MLCSPALLLVDMQNEFVHPQGKLFVPGAPETVPRLVAVLQAFRQAGLPAIHVRREHRPDGSDVETVRREAFRRLGGFCLPGSWGAEFIPELAPLPEERVVVKRGWSAFLGTELHGWLQALGVRTLVIGGTQTPNCVRATLYDATSLGYEVVLLSDGTSSANPEVQSANLRDLAALGVPILSCAELIAHLSPPKGETASI
ncbi:MAG: cysteine hydrolase family protein [Chloroflexia bacterium]